MLINKKDFENGETMRVAGAGTTALGIVGTCLGGWALANQAGYGNGLFGFGGNRNYIDRYDLAQNEKIGGLESMIAKLSAEKYSDHVGLNLFEYVVKANKEQNANINALFNETFKEIGDIKLETRVNKMEIDKNFQLLNQKVDYENKLTAVAIANERAYVNCTFVPAIKKISICDICPTPAVATAVQPTPVCVTDNE